MLPMGSTFQPGTAQSIYSHRWIQPGNSIRLRNYRPQMWRSSRRRHKSTRQSKCLSKHLLWIHQCRIFQRGNLWVRNCLQNNICLQDNIHIGLRLLQFLGCSTALLDSCIRSPS